MWRTRILYLLLVVLLMLPAATPGTDTKTEARGSSLQSPYRLRTSVIGAAGSPGADNQFKTNGTLGQPSVIGIGTASDKVAYLGFWRGIYMNLTEAEVTPAYRNELLQNYPNPFNPVTTIEFSLAHEGNCELKIFNVQGQRIRILVSERKTPGRHKVSWDGRNDRGTAVTSGIYFYRLQAGLFVSVKKMIILR
jgi:hypothetical protein